MNNSILLNGFNELSEVNLTEINGGSTAGLIIGGIALVAGIIASAPVSVPVAVVCTAISIIGGCVSVSDGIYDATH